VATCAACSVVIVERCGTRNIASIGGQIKDDRLTELTVGTSVGLTIASRGLGMRVFRSHCPKCAE
jgi:hypothetical protein